MSRATRSTNRNTRGQEPSLRSRLGVVVLGVLLIGGVVVLATVYFGGIKGEEFSPTDFKRRVFAYVEIPLVRIQITPITRDDTTNDLAKYLVRKKLLGKPQEESRWDLVWANGGQHGEARILCTYLDSMNIDGEEVWLDWSRKNAEYAKILWPAVAKLAGQELYSFVPDLFVLARSATDKDQLQQDIDQSMARSYVFVGRALQAVDNHERAVEFFSEALIHHPDRIDALQGRAESHQAGGDTSSADADRIRLQVLSEKADSETTSNADAR